MTTFAEFQDRLSGPVSYGSGHEREIERDPFCAFDPDDPYGPHSGAYLTARIVASWFHGGQSSALYALASTGSFDRDAIVSELGGYGGECATALRDWVAGAPDDTSEDPCTDHGLEVCPDCGNAGTAIGAQGYYPCTRFLTCWTDPPDPDRCPCDGKDG